MIFVRTTHRPPPTICNSIRQITASLWQGCFYFLISCFFTFSALAEKAAPGGTGQAAPQPSTFEQFIVPFIFIGLLFYFILIRPQQRRATSHNQFLSKLKRGDEVLTASGIFGSIEGLTDQFVILEVAENVRIRVMKSQIASYTKSLETEEKPK